MRFESLALSFVCAVTLHAQTDAQEILLNARQKILESVDRLPHYMCTETVERYRYTTSINRHLSACDEPALKDRKLTLQIQDRLRLDVAISPLREMYAWYGAKEFDDRDLLDIVNDGAISTGEFGGHVSNLFGSSIATFTYNGDRTDEKGRTVCEFGYRVPKDKSRYEFGNRKYSTLTGYDGTILIDAKTFEVLRIVIQTSSLPVETGACYAKTVLDLERVPINGFNLLLPSSARFDIDMLNGSQNGNRVSYSSCHEFHAESELRFDDPAPDTGSSSKIAGKPLPVPPLDLAAGLPFTLKLAEDVDTSIAAAGDPILLTLSTSLKTQSLTVVPAGTVVHGRIMRVQRTYGARPDVTVAVRLEAIEAAGKVRPFAGQGELPVQRFNAGVVSFTRQRVELGSLDAMEARDTAQIVSMNPRDRHVFRAGTEIKWLTLRPVDATIRK
jgi:hypothetical protein